MSTSYHPSFLQQFPLHRIIVLDYLVLSVNKCRKKKKTFMSACKWLAFVVHSVGLSSTLAAHLQLIPHRGGGGVPHTAFSKWENAKCIRSPRSAIRTTSMTILQFLWMKGGAGLKGPISVIVCVAGSLLFHHTESFALSKRWKECE